MGDFRPPPRSRPAPFSATQKNPVLMHVFSLSGQLSSLLLKQQLPIWCYLFVERFLTVAFEWFRLLKWRRYGGRHGAGVGARKDVCGAKTTRRCTVRMVWTIRRYRASHGSGGTARRTTPPTTRRNTAAQPRHSPSPPDTDSWTYSTVTTACPPYVMYFVRVCQL